MTTICAQQKVKVSLCISSTRRFIEFGARQTSPSSCGRDRLHRAETERETHRVEGHQEGGVDFFVGLVGRVQEDALVCVFRSGQERMEVQAEAAVRGEVWLCLVDAAAEAAAGLRGKKSMSRGFW